MPTGSSRALDAVFFDLGGTLFSYRDLRKPMGAIIRQAAERLGVEVDGRSLGRAYNAASRRSFERVSRLPFYLHRDLFVATHRGFAEELGGSADEAFLEWFYESQRRAMIDHMQLREGCEETLGQLRERGLTLSIVSNIDNDYLEPMIERSGLAKLVDHWTSSETARSCKPDARFFRLCLDRTGHPPERVLFVGDSPVHDIAGARGQGMRTALIEEDGAPPPGQQGGVPQEPHHTIRALSELLSIVDSD